eukprot:GILK01002649.1.p1 GENE.GILK01002649.1~~GILK01002649.1.p1  ORF type:complete len:287 (-),score=24.15 GILK01002649.1:1117-1977(-)
MTHDSPSERQLIITVEDGSAAEQRLLDADSEPSFHCDGNLLKRAVQPFLVERPVSTVKYERTRSTTAVLVLMLLSPSFFVWFGLGVLRSAVFAMFGFHIFSCVVFPLLFIRVTNSIELSVLLEPFVYKWREQVKRGLPLFVGFAGCLFGFYAILSGRVIDNVASKMETFGLHAYYKGILVFFLLYFTIVNPLLEEFFWRSFLHHCFGRNERERVFVSCAYALYHFFVLYWFYPTWECMIAVLALCAAGRMFLVITEHVGLLTATIAHSGADFAVMLILFSMLFDWI